MNAGTPDAAAIEQRARDYLAAGRFRKARDEVKPLVKIDRAKYLPLLIEANKKLARELLGKGQVSEAEQVIAYLKTIASTAELGALELDAAAKSGKPNAILSSTLPMLAKTDSALPEEEKRRLADHLVLAFESVEAEAANYPQLAEVRAVHEALEAVALANFERAQELLRPVPQSSVFSHWKLFVKGMTAFYSGDLEKATRFFAGLPPESTPGKASRVYLLVAGRAQLGNQPGSTLMEAVCRLAGSPGLAPVLARAEQKWREGSHAGSYKVLREMVAAFPSDRHDALGALADFYFQAAFALHSEEADEYTYFFDELDWSARTKSLVERARILRLMALTNERFGDFDSSERCWEEFLKIHEQLHGPHPRMASLVYGRLGHAAATQPQSSFVSFFGDSSPPDVACAIAPLEKSIALDPANLDAHLELCRVFETSKMASQRNRLLDTMTARFPENKTVLVAAGRGCLDRQAYSKGLDYLNSAYQLDRLDPLIPELIVLAKVKLARQAYEKKRLEKGAQIFAETSEFIVGDPMNLARGRWIALTQQGLLEALYGDRVRGDELLAQARKLSLADVVFFFFARFAYYELAPREARPFPFATELEAAVKEASTLRAILLLRIYYHFKGEMEIFRSGTEDFLRRYLKKALKQPFTQAEARSLLNEFRPDTVFKEEFLGFAEKLLKLDPKEPFGRLLRLLLKQPGSIPFFRNRGPDPVSEMQSIVEEATRRGDEKTAQLAQALLGRYRMREPSDLDDEQEDEDEDALGSAEDDPIMRAIAEMLANASEADLRQLRKSMAPDMPEEMFDAMVAAARGRMIVPPKPPKPQRFPEPPKPQPPPSDPNQMEFF